MGGQIAGLLGVIVAVPIAGTIKGTIEIIHLHRKPHLVATETVAHEPSSNMKPEE